MCTSIQINFCVFTVLNSNYFACIQIYWSQSRCSLEPKKILDPPLHWRWLCLFSPDYVYCWDHVCFLSNIVPSWGFFIYILGIIKQHKTNLFSHEKQYIIWYSLVDKTIVRVQQFTKHSQTLQSFSCCS